MKQFLGCVVFSGGVHMLASFIGGSFNPFEWPSIEGRVFYAVSQIFVWLAPIMVNYLDGNPNFED